MAQIMATESVSLIGSKADTSHDCLGGGEKRKFSDD